MTTQSSLGSFKVRLSVSFKTEESDYIFLVISISPDLQRLIEKVIIDEETTFTNPDHGSGADLVRYKVKSWVYSSLGSQREILFHKDLVKSAEASFRFSDARRLDAVMTDIKRNIKILVETYFKYTSVDTTVTFKAMTHDQRTI